MISSSMENWGFSRTYRVAAAGLVAALLSASAGRTAEIANDTTAKRLIVGAVQAEIRGDLSRSSVLLHEAVRRRSGKPTPRRQLGQVKFDGNWVTVEESAASCGGLILRQAEYHRDRAATALGEVRNGQLEFARWCRKNDLTMKRFSSGHRAFGRPNNEDALRAVEMRWRDGRVGRTEQIDEQKTQVQVAKAGAKVWAPTIAKWRRAITATMFRLTTPRLRKSLRHRP